MEINLLFLARFAPMLGLPLGDKAALVPIRIAEAQGWEELEREASRPLSDEGTLSVTT